jgi:hypothetical protein
MHKAEPLVHEPSSFEVEITTEELKKYKSPGTDQILVEMIQAGGNTLCSDLFYLQNGRTSMVMQEIYYCYLLTKN